MSKSRALSRFRKITYHIPLSVPFSTSCFRCFARWNLCGGDRSLAARQVRPRARWQRCTTSSWCARRSTSTITRSRWRISSIASWQTPIPAFPPPRLRSFFSSVQFNRLLLGFLTSNIWVNWLLNHYIPIVGFLWPISYLRVRPSVDTFATPLLRRSRQADHFLKGTVAWDGFLA